jgi:hypothetical protein
LKAQITYKNMKTADLVLLSLFMSNNEKCNIAHAPYLELYLHNNLQMSEGPLLHDVGHIYIYHYISFKSIYVSLGVQILF